MKFYICETCGKITTMVNEKEIPTMCCGKAMVEMVPGTSDGATEKHVPVVKQDGRKVMVDVGEAAHPMQEAHFIGWIAIETKEGFQIKKLSPDQEPKAEFVLSESDELVAAYEYCNLHGLWKK